MSLHPMADFFREAHKVKSEFQGNRLVLLSDAAEARKAADTGHEALNSLLSSLSAIGTLIASIDHKDKGYDPDNLDSVGWAIAELSELGGVMAHELHNIEFTLAVGK